MISLFAAAILGLQTPSDAPPLPLPTKVVLTVNGKAFTAKDVEAYLWDWNAAQVGQALTVFELIRQEAEKQKVVITPAEIKQREDIEIQKALGTGPKGQSVDEALKARGVSRSRLELAVKAQMLLEKLADKQFHPADFVRVATLVVRPKSESSADIQSALTKSNNAYAALQSGQGWEKVLPAFASDPQSVPSGGEIGWVKLSEFPPSAKTELESLKLKGYTKPVQTPNGFQIFRLEARGTDATPAEMTDLKSRFLTPTERDIVGQLQKTAKITTSY